MKIKSSSASLLGLLLAAAALHSGCGKSSDAPTAQTGSTRPADAAAVPFEFRPAGTPTFVKGYLPDPKTKEMKEWLFEERDGKLIVDGDIVLGGKSELATRVAEKSLHYLKASLWPKAVVPYELPDNLVNRAVVLAAIEEFHQKTKIKFVARTNEVDYLAFTPLDDPRVGGQSYYGKQGGRQPLWLNRDPQAWNKGTVIHELCHALCVAHEQNRADRNQFVRIQADKIYPGYESQFAQLFGEGKDLNHYDYASIMHYPRNAFSKDGSDTIIPVQAGVVIGQRTSLSAGDIAGLNEIYADELKRP
jgi:hypothetical protein